MKHIPNTIVCNYFEYQLNILIGITVKQLSRVSYRGVENGDKFSKKNSFCNILYLKRTKMTTTKRQKKLSQLPI